MPTFHQVKNGFTLLEIMLVVVIVAIIAAFAIPNYTKSIEQAHLKDAKANLTAIYAAQQIQHSETGSYYPSSATTVNTAAINTNLRLNIIEQGMTYTCTGVAGRAQFTCHAVRSGSSPYTVRTTEAVLSSGNPTCISGAACP